MVIDPNLAQLSNSDNFEKNPGRNNHNASKLIEKYNNLAREALSTGDKILSENYLQHADHFTRILSDQEFQRRSKFSENSPNNKNEKEENKFLNKDQTLNKNAEKQNIEHDTEVEAT